MNLSVYEHAQQNALARVKSYETQAKASISGLRMIAEPSALLPSSTSRRATATYEQFKNWVYISVNTIAKRLAGQQIMLGEMTNASPNPGRAHLGQKSLPGRIEQKASIHDVELILNHPALDLICRPNPLQKKFEFLYISAANLLITGESYWIGGETENGMEIWAVPTSWITPSHKNGLFSGYLYRPDGVATGIPLSPDQVARTYFPDPRDLKAAFSPLTAIIGAARTDENLQGTQEEMFAKGINPNLMITVGRSRGADGRLTDRRPTLTGAHRRQLIRSIREIWGATVNRGDPAIIDGLIESVHKLQSTPQEMDFLQSGEIVKKRIFQAYSLNPIIAGEVTGANRAQAIQADKQFALQAVNPVVDAFSETLTDFVGPMFETPQRMLIWINPLKPTDPELDLSRWKAARATGDVTRNEFRTHILGLHPVDENVERNQLLSGTGGMQVTMQVLTALSTGAIARDQAKVLLILFLEIDEALADAMVGQDLPRLAPPPEEDNTVAASIEQLETKLSRLHLDMADSLKGSTDAMIDAVKQSHDSADVLHSRSLAAQVDAMRTMATQMQTMSDKEVGNLKLELEKFRVTNQDEAIRGMVENRVMGGQIRDIDSALEILRTSKQSEPVQVNVQNDVHVPAPVVNNDIDVDVPETNITVQSTQGEKGEPGQPGPVGPKGDPSDVNVNVEQPEVNVNVEPPDVTVNIDPPEVTVNVEKPDAPGSATIRHADGTVSKVDLEE